jgi:multidrug efflux pump subunit AcrA (membrane-fusion protein)
MARLDTTSREIQLRETEAARAKAREQLAMLRRGTRAEEVALREAAMAEQQALLARAEAEFQRARQLFQDHLISRSELERLQADYLAVRQKHEAALQAFQMAREGPRPEEITQAEADLAQATARVERIQHEIRQATIRAPISGHVVKKHVEAGAWVQPGTAVVSLIALDPVFVTGPVGERDIARVRTGQPAQVTADAYPGQVFSGTVTAIVPGADTGSRAFPVRVTLRNPDARLKAGMFARVSVRTGQGRQGLFVPKDAVVRRGGQEYVFVVDGDTARQVKIEIGALVDGLVEVRARELAPGLKAITLGNEFLQPGMKIRPTP